MKAKVRKLLEIMHKQRKRCGLNQERVAESLGIQHNTFSEMETGKSGFTLERWLQWCAVLKLTPSDVLKRWQEDTEFVEISKHRLNGYYKTIHMMIKYGFGGQLDVIMSLFDGMVKEERNRRRIKQSRKEINKYFPKLKT